MIDTHAHIEGSDYDDDRGETLARAVEAGVRCIVAVGADMPTSRAAVALAEANPNVLATVGVHPHDAKTYTGEDASELERLAGHCRVRAIGEMGLDYHYDLSPRPVQASCFESQLALTARVGQAAVIHLREAEEDALAIMKAALPAGAPARRGGEGRIGPVVIHCFMGDREWAGRWLDLGCYLGIGGAVTFRKMDALRDAVRFVPLDRILLETDCPYMTPHPFRGRRNEPAYLPLVARAVADAKEMPLDAIVQATTANAGAVFGAWMGS